MSHAGMEREDHHTCPTCALCELMNRVCIQKKASSARYGEREAALGRGSRKNCCGRKMVKCHAESGSSPSCASEESALGQRLGSEKRAGTEGHSGNGEVERDEKTEAE